MPYTNDHDDARQQLLFAELARNAEIEPSPALDRQIRQRLSRHPFGAASRIRPAVALALTTAAFACALGALAIGLAEAGAAERGLLLAFGVGLAYLVLSTATVLPILMRDHLRERLRSTGAHA